MMCIKKHTLPNGDTISLFYRQFNKDSDFTNLYNVSYSEAVPNYNGTSLIVKVLRPVFSFLFPTNQLEEAHLFYELMVFYYTRSKTANVASVMEMSKVWGYTLDDSFTINELYFKSIALFSDDREQEVKQAGIDLIKLVAEHKYRVMQSFLEGGVTAKVFQHLLTPAHWETTVQKVSSDLDNWCVFGDCTFYNEVVPVTQLKK